MGKQVTVLKSTSAPLPNNQLYGVGNVVVLSDAQYAQLPTWYVNGAYFGSISTVADPTITSNVDTEIASLGKGAANGVAPLDSSGLVPVANLPVSNTTLVLASNGTPASGLGVNGDFAIDYTTGNLWGPKASGAWPGSATLQYGNFGAFGYPNTNFITGRWYPATIGTGTALLMTQNNMIAQSFGVLKAHTFLAIGLNVTIAGTGGTLRFGIYTDNGSGYPSTLVQDFGTVAATSTGAVTVTSIVASLNPALYWIAVVAQGGSVQPTVTTLNPLFPPLFFGSSAAGAAAGNQGYGGSTVSGALPGTYPGGATILGANSIPYVQLQA